MNKDENKVFVVTTGEYSDYRIDRVFSTRKKALEYLDTKDDSYTLEVFDLDEPIERKTHIYEISFELDKKKVAEVMQGFDFEKTRKMMMPSKAKVSIGELKVIAKNLLFMCIEHQDREFWWAGGMHRGGLCACYDDKWGLSLNYIAVANKVRIPKD